MAVTTTSTFNYEVKDSVIIPRYKCGITGPRVDVNAHGERYAITLLVGDYHSHALTEKNRVKCTLCAATICLVA